MNNELANIELQPFDIIDLGEEGLRIVTPDGGAVCPRDMYYASDAYDTYMNGYAFPAFTIYRPETAVATRDVLNGHPDAVKSIIYPVPKTPRQLEIESIRKNIEEQATRLAELEKGDA